MNHTCGCRACLHALDVADGIHPLEGDWLCGSFPRTAQFIVCSECGNKRCPHANDHRNECTNSNDPGQPGSAYP